MNCMSASGFFDQSGTGNSLRANSIFSNGGLGIDLGDDGVTPNDPPPPCPVGQPDCDTGPNNLQNFPVISLAQLGATTHVAGSLSSTPNTTFVIDFYANITTDESEFAEGERHLGSTSACGENSVATDAFGYATFDVVLLASTVSGESITATATDCLGNNTSEFSAAIEAVLSNADPVPTFTASPVVGVTGQPLAFAGNFTDPDDDTWSLTVDCGPGSTAGNQTIDQTLKTFSLTCTYSTTGTRTVTATVTDDADPLGSGTVESQVVIDFANLQTGVCCSGNGTALVVGSLPVNDRIHVNPIGNDGSLQVTITDRTNDVVVYQSTFVQPAGGFSRIVVFGQAADDHIQIAGSIEVPACVHAGAGNDNVKGGSGNDILIGGEGDDLLVGGNGRDLLIGGIGSDRIVGNPDDDILIAGTTDHDNNEQALCDIMKEWTRSDADYATRVGHLRGDSGAGTGLNGSVLLASEGSAATVHDDGAVDVLTGSAGQDWFLLNLDGEVKDKVTDLSAEEFANDLDFIGGP
jgi:Ca2+-binding RTX toxin-like protein